jgi:hypothetical protein
MTLKNFNKLKEITKCCQSAIAPVPNYVQYCVFLLYEKLEKRHRERALLYPFGKLGSKATDHLQGQHLLRN